jgi:AcrR family transcriptional regulator
LFRRIVPGPHAMSRNSVRQHQRMRLVGALIAVSGEGRFAQATITELTRLAGVSRRTFYEQFADVDTFRRDAFAIVATGLARRVHADGNDRRSPARAAAALTDAVAREPRALALLCAGASEDQEGTLARPALTRAAHALCEAFGVVDGMPPILAIAVAAGAFQLLAVWGGDPRTLPEARDQLSRWFSTLTAPRLGELAHGPLPKLAVACDALAAATPADGERWLLNCALRSVIEFGMEAGSAPVAIADIAGISVETVLACYGDGITCVARALERFENEALEAALQACAAAEPASAVGAGCAALLGRLAPIAEHAYRAELSPASVRPCGCPDARAVKAACAARIAQHSALGTAPWATDVAVGTALWHLASSAAARAPEHRPLVAQYMAFLLLASRVGPTVAMCDLGCEAAPP